MLRCVTGFAVVGVSLVLVAHGTGGDEKKTPPDFFGKITDVKKAGPDAKGLGTITVHTKKKGDPADAGKDVTVKVGKKTEIKKFVEKGTPPAQAEFGDLTVDGFVAVWTVEGKADVAKRIVILPKKKAD